MKVLTSTEYYPIVKNYVKSLFNKESGSYDIMAYLYGIHKYKFGELTLKDNEVTITINDVEEYDIDWTFNSILYNLMDKEYFFLARKDIPKKYWMFVYSPESTLKTKVVIEGVDAKLDEKNKNNHNYFPFDKYPNGYKLMQDYKKHIENNMFNLLSTFCPPQK